MRIAICQYDIVWNNPKLNTKKINYLLSKADLKGVDLLLLPEMFSSGFSLPIGTLAEEIYEISKNFLITTSINYGVPIGGSFPASPSISFDKPLNSFRIYLGQNEVAQYNKLHLFPLSSERSTYAAGNKLVQVKIKDINLALSICYDLRFSNIFFQQARNVEGIINIANWPSSRLEHWLTLLSARAIENQCYIIGVNRIGSDPTNTYPGNSVVIDFNGQTILNAQQKEGVFIADIDLQSLKEFRSKYPFINDIRDKI